MDTFKFMLDVAPQIIAIVCLAVFSWRRMNVMSQHLDDHLWDQDGKLEGHRMHLKAISGQLTQLVNEQTEDPDEHQS